MNSSFLRSRLSLAALLAAIVLALYFLPCDHPFRRSLPDPVTPAMAATEAPRYVGATVCGQCHAQAGDRWRGSHHALAMQAANETTVLGDFSGARHAYGGVVSRFFRRDGKYFVNTDGADGHLADFEVKYTFGVYPLQQYLIELPGGRLQALSIVWDTRPRKDGGQRWYHLYPGEHIKAGDPLHWTARSQNWNYMCAACHSTDLRKNYDAAADTFATRWSEINVACEACHGPGSGHVDWARQPDTTRKSEARMGLVNRSTTTRDRRWVFAEGATIAHRVDVDKAGEGSDVCFPCHSRRRQITEPPIPGASFLQNYAPTLLDAGAYHADGQIDGEVYEYGSFVQSRMHRAGVVCVDCHDPHSLKLKADDNRLCAQCHRTDAFDSVSHHRHKTGSPGSRCVECHMPAKTYMGVDRRRDHGFRVPRPDVSIRHKVPNTCTQCHAGKSDRWAAQAIERWRDGKRTLPAPVVEALAAGRDQTAEAGRQLAATIHDGTQPGIVRATALRSLPAPLSTAARDAVRAGIADTDALVRSAAARTAQRLDAREQARLVGPLLLDPVRLVRTEAARTLAGIPDTAFPPEQLAAKHAATDELIASEQAAAERPESHLNLGDIQARLGRLAEAEVEFRQAIRLDPRFVPARVNLADLYRATQRDAAAQTLLEETIGLEPKSAEAHHALGLLKVRQGDRQGALASLARAAALSPGVPRYAYVYGVALHDSGAIERAIGVLEQARRRTPGDQDTLVALATFESRRGNRKAALDYAEQLTRLDPDNPRIKVLRQQLAEPGR